MKKEIERKEITEDLYLYMDLDTIFDGSLQEVADNILNLEKRLKVEHQLIVQQQDRFFKYVLRIDNGDYPEDGVELKISGVRMETDVEFEKRVAKSKAASIAQKASAKKRNEAKEKAELELYNKLKLKFEP